jgi:hypothetical protein
VSEGDWQLADWSVLTRNINTPYCEVRESGRKWARMMIVLCKQLSEGGRERRWQEMFTIQVGERWGEFVFWGHFCAQKREVGESLRKDGHVKWLVIQFFKILISNRNMSERGKRGEIHELDVLIAGKCDAGDRGRKLYSCGGDVKGAKSEVGEIGVAWNGIGRMHNDLLWCVMPWFTSFRDSNRKN